MTSQSLRNAQGLSELATKWATRVLYADRGIIVLNKPSGLICQSSSEEVNHEDDTVNVDNEFQGLLQYLQHRFNLDTKPYPVHRLDKGTTGTLVLARTKTIARDLSLQFQSHAVEKRYLAVVRGGQKSFPAQSGEIRTGLEIHRGSVSISSRGTPSATDWKLMDSSSKVPLSLVKLRLHTGVKHQLRAHLAQFLRTPVLGDTIHSRKPPSKAITEITTIPQDRLFLHASHISLLRYRKNGPSKQLRLGISAPLPSDFVKICTDVGITISKSDAKAALFADGQWTNDVEGLDAEWFG